MNKKLLSFITALSMLVVVTPTTLYAADTSFEECDDYQEGDTVVPEKEPTLDYVYPEDGMSGQCGTNVTWSYNDSLLTISGSGAMYNYEIGEEPWYYWVDSFTKVVVEEGVTSIGDYAFYDCPDLVSVELADSVTNIGVWSFADCDIINMNLSSNLKTIDKGAFRGCSYWADDIVLPDTVTDIGAQAFSRCSSIQRVVINNNVMEIPSSAFYDCKNLAEVIIPDSITGIGSQAFCKCSSIRSISLPESVTEIGANAFAYCSSLQDFDIPSGVTTLNEGVFRKCYSLNSFDIPDNITTIGDSVFYGCINMESVTIPENVTSIDEQAFDYCIKLTEIEIPSSVTSIGKRTFASCKSLQSITIPNSVTSIGEYAFYNCNSLTDVYYYGTNTEWNSINIADYNDCLSAAKVYYNYGATPTPTTTPTAAPTTIPEPEDSSFTMLRDNYSFPNIDESFGYYDGYKIPLERYVALFGTTYGTIYYTKADPWNGSCYGFSASSELFYTGDLDYTDYDSEASSLYDIPAPKSMDSEVTKLIETYQISQSLDRVAAEKTKNKNDMEGIITAVEHFEETGEEPIVLSVRRSATSGHAVVPYKIETNSDGSYSIYVYDNNYPTSTDRIVTINKDMDGFYYNAGSHTYTYNITYAYASTIYSAYAADKVSLYSVEEETAAIIINSDNISITNSDGISIENIAGAYEIVLEDEQSETIQTKYIVPADEYTIKNYSSDIDALEVSAANDYDYQIVRTKDLNASIVVGINSLSGRIYTSIEAPDTSNNSIELLNSIGICTVFESTGKYLGVKGGTTIAAVEADSSVLCNGTEVSVGTEDAVASLYMATEPEITDGDSGESDYSVTISSNSLSYANSAVGGSVAVSVYNNTTDLTSAKVMVGLYSNDGQFISLVACKDVVLGLGSNYINIGDISCSDVDNGCYAKVFVWSNLQLMTPLTDCDALTISL